MLGSVSVVIPTYNGSRYIAEALQSIFAQTVLPYEIVVVDDASTDNTITVVNQVAANSPVPVRLIPLARNSGGPAKPINIGINAACGDLIAILDQDDVFAPNKLEEQAAVLRADTSLMFVCGLCGHFENPNDLHQSAFVLRLLRAKGTSCGNYQRLASPDALYMLLTCACFPMGYPGFMFQRQFWQQKGGVDETLSIASDFEFLCWLAHKGPIGFIDRVHYFRRQHGKNMTKNTLSMLLDLATVRERYLTIAGHLALDPEDRIGLQGQYRKLAYWLREAGSHRNAFRCLMLANRIWGWNVDRGMAAAKVTAHWLLYRIGCRSSNPNLKALLLPVHQTNACD